MDTQRSIYNQQSNVGDVPQSVESANEQSPQIAEHFGVLEMAAETEIPCVILEDKTRLITHRGILNHLGRKSPGVNRQIADKCKELNLPSFAVADNIQPYLCEDFADIAKPVPFKMGNRATSYGYNPQVLIELCNAYVQAMIHGNLDAQQHHIAVKCSQLLSTLSKTGITALIDEATGYEKERPQGELARFFEYFLNKEADQWSETFDKEYYEHIYRLWGWENDPKEVRNHPQCVGNITNKLIYKQMPEELQEELERLNPVNENGQRRYRHHQFLKSQDAGGVGKEWLREQKQKVITLMRVSNDKDELIDFMKRDQEGEKTNEDETDGKKYPNTEDD